MEISDINVESVEDGSWMTYDVESLKDSHVIHPEECIQVLRVIDFEMES